LLDRQESGTIFDKERNLLIACAILILLMNISTGQYVLYPFKIFSTVSIHICILPVLDSTHSLISCALRLICLRRLMQWVHEMCHGLAAILSGGYIAKLEIFQNGSGLAYTASQHGTFVSSAGYPGTAVTGCLLLIFRRTTLGPTIMTMGLGGALLLSCALYVRNQFGLIFLPIEGVVLLLAGWLLPAVLLDNLFNFLACTVSLNAFENIQDLYGSQQGYAGGELRNTDAHSVAEGWGGDYRVWATIWLIMSIVMTTVGILAARDARALPWSNSTTSNNTSSPSTTTLPVVKYGNAKTSTTATATANDKSVWSKITSGGTPSWRNPTSTTASQPGYVAHVV